MRVAAPWFLLALTLAVVGGLLYALADGVIQAVSIGIMGLAGVVAVSGLFYAIGISEERERERGD